MDTPDMFDYNRSARLYWYALVATGVALGAWVLSEFSSFTGVQRGQLLASGILVIGSSYAARKIFL